MFPSSEWGEVHISCAWNSKCKIPAVGVRWSYEKNKKNCLPGNSQTAATLRHAKAVYRTVGDAGLALVLVRADL